MKRKILIFFFVTALFFGCAEGDDNSDATSANSNSQNNSSTSKSIISTFQTADVVIGQINFNDNSFNGGNGFSNPAANTANTGFGGVYVSGDFLFFPDTTNNRVLIYDDVPQTNGQSADALIGQIDFSSRNSGTSSSSLSSPTEVVLYKSQLFVAESDNNRVLIFNLSNDLTNNYPQTADIVVGQNNFISSSSSCTAAGLKFPVGIEVTNDKLIVADEDNNRVLIWNSIPTLNGQAADLVLGQQNFTSCSVNQLNSSSSESTLYDPRDVWSDGDKLIVSDADNNRILIWNTFPSSNNEAADVVLGQSNFSNNARNDDDQDNIADSNTSSRTLYHPHSIEVYSGSLIVGDGFNNRVLIWDQIPNSNFKSADIVLGQNSFINRTANDDDQNNVSDGSSTARTMSNPQGVKVFNDQLFITDGGNNRVLIFSVTSGHN